MDAEKQAILTLLDDLTMSIKYGPVTVWESDTLRCLGCRDERPEFDADHELTECAECGPYEESVSGNEEWWGKYANKAEIWGPYDTKEEAEEDLS